MTPTPPAPEREEIITRQAEEIARLVTVLASETQARQEAERLVDIKIARLHEEAEARQQAEQALQAELSQRPNLRQSWQSTTDSLHAEREARAKHLKWCSSEGRKLRAAFAEEVERRQQAERELSQMTEFLDTCLCDTCKGVGVEEDHEAGNRECGTCEGTGHDYRKAMAQLTLSEQARAQAEQSLASLRTALETMIGDNSLVLSPEPPTISDVEMVLKAPINMRRDWWREGYAFGARSVADQLAALLDAPRTDETTP